MGFLKRAALLLLLALIGANAESGPENCGGLNVTLPHADLHKIYGHWVLVWGVSDGAASEDLLQNLTSSHVDLDLRPDNGTILYEERNRFRDNTCSRYYMNLTLPAAPSEAGDYELHLDGGALENNGIMGNFSDSGHVDFFETCPDCLVMVYTGNLGHYLLAYRREGLHQDVELMKEAHSGHHKLADCLGFPHENPFMYDGAADFCEKTSFPEVMEH